MPRSHLTTPAYNYTYLGIDHPVRSFIPVTMPHNRAAVVERRSRFRW